MIDIFRQAAATLLGHPLRSSLGALAIAVGVATIVVVVTALEGVRLYTESTTARTFGSETFVIAQVASGGRVSRRELRTQLERNPPIRRGDTTFLNRHRDGIVLYAPTAQTRGQVTGGALSVDDALITGAPATIASIRQIDLERGRFFTEREDQSGAPVAVVGADIAATLLASANPGPQSIRLAGRRFTVIGVQSKVGSTGAGSVDKYVWIPLRAYERAFGAPRSYQVFARGDGGHSAIAAEDRARSTLRARRRLLPNETDNFDVLTPDAARSFVASLSQRIGAAAGPISLMALMAAIVVVTNTILVSVTQRTREIGVRRALGAARSRIVKEVIAESLLMAIAGGAAGAAVAWAAMTLVKGATGFPVSVAPATLAWAMSAAALSGLAAAWYPARRATRIDVIMAIRAE